MAFLSDCNRRRFLFQGAALVGSSMLLPHILRRFPEGSVAIASNSLQTRIYAGVSGVFGKTGDDCVLGVLQARNLPAHTERIQEIRTRRGFTGILDWSNDKYQLDYAKDLIAYVGSSPDLKFVAKIFRPQDLDSDPASRKNSYDTWFKKLLMTGRFGAETFSWLFIKSIDPTTKEYLYKELSASAPAWKLRTRWETGSTFSGDQDLCQVARFLAACIRADRHLPGDETKLEAIHELKAVLNLTSLWPESTEALEVAEGRFQVILRE